MSQENPASPVPPDQATPPAQPATPADQAPKPEPADNAAAIRKTALEDNAFLRAVFNKPAKLQTATPAAKPAEPAAAAAEPEPKPGEPAKPESAKPAEPAKPRKRAPERDAIAEAIAAGAAAGTAAAERLAGTTPQPAAPPAVDLKELEELLPEAYSDRVTYVSALAQEQPVKYGDVGKFLRDATSAQTAYSKKWEKSNPGQKFNPEADEHDEFFEQWGLENKFPELDSDINRLREDRSKAKEEAAFRRIDALERADAERVESAARPVAQRAIGQAVAAALGEEFDKAMRTGEFKAKLETDPLAQTTFAAAVEYVQTAPWNPRDPASPPWETVASEIVRFHATGKLGDTNAPQTRALLSLAERMDRELAALPRDETVAQDGRKYATRAQYLAMPEDQREGYWVIGQAEMLDYVQRHVHAYTQSYQKQVKDMVNKLAPKLGFKNAETKNGAPVPAQPTLLPQPSRISVPSVPAPAIVSTPGAAPASPQRPRNAFLEAVGIKH